VSTAVATAVFKKAAVESILTLFNSCHCRFRNGSGSGSGNTKRQWKIKSGSGKNSYPIFSVLQIVNKKLKKDKVYLKMECKL